MSSVGWITRYMKSSLSNAVSGKFNHYEGYEDLDGWLWLNMLPLYALCTTCILHKEFVHLSQTLQDNIVSFATLFSSYMEPCLKSMPSKTLRFSSHPCVENLDKIREFSINHCSHAVEREQDGTDDDHGQSPKTFVFSVYVNENDIPGSGHMVASQIEVCLENEGRGLYHISVNLTSSHIRDEEGKHTTKCNTSDDLRMLLPTFDQIQKVKHTQSLSKIESHVHASRCDWDPFSKLAIDMMLSPSEYKPLNQKYIKSLELKTVHENSNLKGSEAIDMDRKRQRVANLSPLKRSRSKLLHSQSTFTISTRQNLDFDFIEDPPIIQQEKTKKVGNTTHILNPTLPTAKSSLLAGLTASSSSSLLSSSSSSIAASSLNISEKTEKWKEKKSSAVDIAKKFSVSF